MTFIHCRHLMNANGPLTAGGGQVTASEIATTLVAADPRCFVHCFALMHFRFFSLDTFYFGMAAQKHDTKRPNQGQSVLGKPKSTDGRLHYEQQVNV